MPIFDDALAGIVSALDPYATAAGLVRRRGGLARSIAWAEIAGRLPDHSWAELRVHHRPKERTLSAGLLVYQPLAHGGRTIPHGDVTYGYDITSAEVEGRLVTEVTRWLQALAMVPAGWDMVETSTPSD